MKATTLILKKTLAISLLLVSSVCAMELPIEYSKDTQKSFKAQLMAGKIDECFKYIERKIEEEKEKNRHYWALAHEALTCINRTESLLNILKRIEDLLSSHRISCRLGHLAAECNDVKLLRYLKENQMVIDFKDAKGLTPLFYAARGNASEAMKLLLEWGDDINARDHKEKTPLHYAAEENAIQAMKLLKDWGADINPKNDYGETPLHPAAKANAIEAMKLLKHWGADINPKNDWGETPLHYAARNNVIEAMKLLKDWSAARNHNEKTPLHPAAKANAFEAMKLLKDWGADMHARDHNEKTPLHYAAEGNAIQAMKLLKDWGDDINARDHNEKTPLHYAAEENAIQAMKLLKDWGADINPKNDYGETPLHPAAKANAFEAMKLLKDWGADINAKNDCRETPLHCASRNNAIEAMKLLKHWGADINAKSYLGTPLHYAIKENAIETIKLLYEWGANIGEKETLNGDTALALAIRYDLKESMDFLSFLGANRDLVNTNYKDEEAKNRLKCFKYICKINQMKPSQPLDDKEGMKLLHEAVENGLFCSVRKLLNSGKIKDINQKNDTGYSILHEAADKNKIYVVKILLTTPEIEPYSRTYGTMKNCPTCKAQTPYDKKLKTHPGNGCQTCGSLTPYDLASPDIKEIYDEMRKRIAIICCLKKLPIPKELAYMIFRLCNYQAKHTHLPKGLFHKAHKVQEEKQNGGEEKYLTFEAQRAEIARERKEPQAMMAAAVLGDLERLKQLVSSGADLLTQDWCGYNALHFAVLHNGIGIAQYIMQCEPRTAIAKSKDGLNPIDVAIKHKKSKELLQALYEETQKITISNQK